MDVEHHRVYKHTKFRQNPRGDPKFLVDLTMTLMAYNLYVAAASIKIKAIQLYHLLLRNENL